MPIKPRIDKLRLTANQVASLEGQYLAGSIHQAKYNLMDPQQLQAARDFVANQKDLAKALDGEPSIYWSIRYSNSWTGKKTCVVQW